MYREKLLNDPIFIERCNELNLKWSDFIVYDNIVVAVKDKENSLLYTVLDEEYNDIGITDIYNLYENISKMCHKNNIIKKVITKTNTKQK